MEDKTILIVDDEPTSLELVDYLLKKENYRTILASRGEEALKQVRRDPPDLIVLDFMMPHMCGADICREVKSDPLTKSIPIIFLSAVVSERDIEAGIRAGADAFIVKPFDPGKILDKIEELLNKNKRSSP